MIVVLTGATALFVNFIWKDKSDFLSPVSKTESSRVLSKTKQKAYASNSLFEKPVNILLLGVDARKGDKNPRCDAIHLLSLDLKKNQITITSVPRGTVVGFLNIATQSAYLGNMCHLKGVDFAVNEIKKITNIKPDYVIKVGFSQTLGILRKLKLPTVPTLQFLRNRRFGIGDNQRSYNQAMFINDMYVNHFEDIFKMPKPVRYLSFKLLDTEMPYEVANYLLEVLNERKIHQNPDNIILVTKPSRHPNVKEIHYNSNLYQNPEDWQDKEYNLYQKNLLNYLYNLISSGFRFLQAGKTDYAHKKIKTPFEQKLWLQVENEKERQELHFQMLKLYTLSLKQKSSASTLILDYITEQETDNNDYYQKKGEELLKSINH